MSRWRLGLPWLVLFAAVGLRAQAPPFTLEQVMGSPFPAGLTAAATGEHVAWTVDLRGARNIFAADGPGFTPRALTHYDADDGQPIVAVHLSPDGRTAVYVRGTERNALGNSADPTSDIEQPQQQVWSVRDGGAPKLLGTMGCDQEGCEDLELSPDGRWVVWPAQRTLWIAPTDGSVPARPLLWAAGDNQQPRWSPDGKTIAFVSQRPGHAFIAVYTLGAERLRYIAPSVDIDSEPRWSPDGRQIVFVRQLNQLPHPTHPLPLWQLWVADAQTLAAHPFWASGTRPQDGIDPDYNTPFEEALNVGAGHQVLFSSERDGWNHLYAVSDLPAPGNRLNRARLLTPGRFEIQDVLLAPDGQTAVFSSNQGDVDRRHLWRVGLDGSAPPSRLTGGDGIEWAPVETGDGQQLLCLGSTATTPAMPYRIDAGGAPGNALVMLGQLPTDFPSTALVTPVPVVFPSGPYRIHAQLFQPRGPARPRPTLIFVHGGPHRQMMLGFHPMDYYHNAYAENQYLVALGFNVLSINYRGGIMYGRAFRLAPGTGRHGGRDYQDVLAAVAYLRSLPTVDARRLGIWGGSYGGYLTALALARNSNLFAAGVDFHGVHDWSTVYDGAGPPPPASPGPAPGQSGNPAFDASPDAFVRGWRSPVLLIQGDDDRNVDFAQTIDLAERLRAQGVPFQQLIFPDEVHVFLRWRTWIRGYAATAEFFQRQLRPASGALSSPAPSRARPPRSSPPK